MEIIAQKGFEGKGTGAGRRGKSALSGKRVGCLWIFSGCGDRILFRRPARLPLRHQAQEWRGQRRQAHALEAVLEIFAEVRPGVENGIAVLECFDVCGSDLEARAEIVIHVVGTFDPNHRGRLLEAELVFLCALSASALAWNAHHAKFDLQAQDVWRGLDGLALALKRHRNRRVGDLLRGLEG